MYIIALEIIFMFVNLSKHTYILYTYTALFNHRILMYLLFVIIYNPLDINRTYFCAAKFISGTVHMKSMMIKIE